ncbi:MAG: transglycosylase SLT domain-containing protein [Acidobacteriota bacterium]
MWNGSTEDRQLEPAAHSLRACRPTSACRQARPFRRTDRFLRADLARQAVLLRALCSCLTALPTLILLLVGSTARSALASDLRISLVEQQVERNHEEALLAVEHILAEDPEVGHRLGLDYLRGHLLLLLDRRQEAQQAFATSMGATPTLEAYSRYRLAREQYELGHPEVAAGLVATLLGSGPPRALQAPAMRLLQRTISEGGDCRLLGALNAQRFRRGDRRRLQLLRAECKARSGDRVRARQQLLELLEESRGDDIALAAATKIAGWLPEDKDARTHLLIGLGFYEHREFSLAIQHLARAIVRLPSSDNVSAREAFECRYALARSHFWQERYQPAAAAFGALVKMTASPSRRAQVIYQRARSLELADDFTSAAAGFDQAYRLDPGGRWTDGALIGNLRLEWLAGNEEAALGALDGLLRHRRTSVASRALVFLISSDLVEGRTDRADAWLDRAASLGRVPSQELDYWRGRLAELRRESTQAVGHYVRALQEDPYHPFGTAALARLTTGDLAPVTRGAAARLAASDQIADLYASWLLLGDEQSQGRRARQKLERRVWSDPAAIPFLRLAREPTADWPLWQSALSQPEEMLLALGIFEEGASVVLRHFPVAKPHLAYTGSTVLAQSGDTKRALYIAEILGKRIPDPVPTQLLPTSYRRLLFPFGYSYLILAESGKQGVDPHLLAAIIREESRFDPVAFSGASARGLTQFILPTARGVAERAGLGPLEPEDLERPEIAISLGAAYLRELSEEFAGSLPQVIAGYNAGEPQSALWRRYCSSGEPEEYLSKVGFRETRGYLTKVLTSRAHYRELYPDELADAGSDEPKVRAASRDPGE